MIDFAHATIKNPNQTGYAKEIFGYDVPNEVLKFKCFLHKDKLGDLTPLTPQVFRDDFPQSFRENGYLQYNK